MRAWVLASIAGGLIVAGGSARAADVGEIAIVPDVGGQIQAAAVLPTSRYLERAACAFYETHADTYDALFIYTTIPLNMLNRTQQGWPLRSAAMGIGRDLYFDTTSRFCATRLRQAVKMGDIQSFDDDPDVIYTGFFGFTLSGIELLAHEFGHQWLVSVTYDRGDGQRHCVIRGFNDPGEPPVNADCDGYRNSDFNQHWSYYFNSGSVMYGNTIEDLGGGQFRLTNPGAKYSELDQYLMGLRDPTEVAPMFLVDDGNLLFGTASFPIDRTRDEVITGDRIDFTIDDVIRAEGPRVPARDMCHWKAAFVIVHEENTPPTAQEIARVDTYRLRWEEFYAEATDRRGSFDTTLAGTGPGTTDCPAPENPNPPTDAGQPPQRQDAATPIADATPSDAGSTDPTDATTPEPQDAATQTPQPMQNPQQNDEPRVIIDDGCACNHAGRERSPLIFGVVLITLFLRNRKSA